MASQISQGIKIDVEVFYQEELSRVARNEYVFGYRITIENYNPFAIRVVQSHWHIVDSSGKWQEMVSEGIIKGIKPYIESDKFLQYMGSCTIDSEIGKIQGEYIVENQFTKETFKVIIPEFILIIPAKLN